MRARTLCLGILAVVGLGLGMYALIGWDLTAWWRLRALARATDADYPAAAEAVAELDNRAVAGLLTLLRSEDALTCRNARAGFVCLARRWQTNDPRWPVTVRTCAAAFPGLSPTGKTAFAGVAAAARPEGAEGLSAEEQAAWCEVLGAVPAEATEDLRGAGLELAGWLLTATDVAEALPPARAMVRACLSAGNPALRLRAVELALVPGVEVYEEVATLLRDPVVEVRRTAMLVVGSAAQAVLDETLLPCLRDSDPEVQRLCEAALRGRGLTSQHLRLGRLLTDPIPLERLKVLDLLDEARDLEPSVWLRRLSHDPADSVRAAAIRMMAEQTQVDLRDRLEQMRASDPSPTVGELATFYLRR